MRACVCTVLYGANDVLFFVYCFAQSLNLVHLFAKNTCRAVIIGTFFCTTVIVIHINEQFLNNLIVPCVIEL